MGDGGCIERITAVLAAEAEAVRGLVELAHAQRAPLERACALIIERCGDGRPGRLVATGVGKAGIIAQKLSATFASTGTPSFFLHPTEARHGDLGMLTAQDVVLALSNSGASEELVALLPSLAHAGVELIALVGKVVSPLGARARIAITIGEVVEACPLKLAPSASTTAMLALGDALALAVQGMRDFTKEQYARFHPGGALGRQLMTCSQAMRTLERVAAVNPDASILACMRATGAARSGSAVLVGEGRRLLGIFTDGDLRRLLARESDPAAALRASVRTHASCPCLSVREDELLQAALRICGERKINELPVVDAHGALVGLLDLQDLVQRGFAVGAG